MHTTYEEPLVPRMTSYPAQLLLFTAFNILGIKIRFNRWLWHMIYTACLTFRCILILRQNTESVI